MSHSDVDFPVPDHISVRPEQGLQDEVLRAAA